jgi:hypothetical protein
VLKNPLREPLARRDQTKPTEKPDFMVLFGAHLLPREAQGHFFSTLLAAAARS